MASCRTTRRGPAMSAAKCSARCSDVARGKIAGDGAGRRGSPLRGRAAERARAARRARFPGGGGAGRGRPGRRPHRGAAARRQQAGPRHVGHHEGARAEHRHRRDGGFQPQAGDRRRRLQGRGARAHAGAVARLQPSGGISDSGGHRDRLPEADRDRGERRRPPARRPGGGGDPRLAQARTLQGQGCEI